MLIMQENNSTDPIIHQDLVKVQQRIFTRLGLSYSQPILESESVEYGAYFFELNGFSDRFRVAKITPKKIGQFVTL